MKAIIAFCFLKGLMKFTFIYLLSLLSYPLYAEDAEIAGNVNPNYKPRESGRVSTQHALNLPPTHYYADASMVFSASASYTLWVPYQNGLIIAISNAPPASLTDLTPGNALTPSSHPCSGLKVNVEKCGFYDDWTAGISYVWFNNPNNLRSKGFDINAYYKSPWIPDSYQDIYSIESSFSNQFNEVRGKLYKPLAFTSNFILSPWICLVGAWESQYLNANIDYEGTGSDFYIFTMENKQFWWCIGPGSGLEIAFKTPWYLSLYLNAGGSLNLARHIIYQTSNQTNLFISSTVETLLNTASFLWKVEPMIESSLGLRFDYSFSKTAIFLKSSWDLQTWFSHNGFITTKNRRGYYSNYSMQGLTVSAGCYF